MRLAVFLGVLTAGALGATSAHADACTDAFQAANEASTCCGHGAYSCDGNDANGCECRPRSSCETVNCAGASCARTMQLNDSACADAPPGCANQGGSGLCRDGLCDCILPNGSVWTPPDMATQGGNGSDHPGCSYSSVPNGAGLAAVLLIGTIFALALRRRRRRN